MITYQDLMAAPDRNEALTAAVDDHKKSDLYRMAVDAEEYDARRNVTITRYQKLLYTLSGQAVPDNFTANHKIVSGYFPRFVVQLNQYLLGNGVQLPEEQKKKLGKSFDRKLQQLGRAALVGGAAFGFWNYDHLEIWKVTEFVPLWDEETGELRAGIRFWQLAAGKPMQLIFYEADGYTRYALQDHVLRVTEEKHTYKRSIRQSKADGVSVEDAGNYGTLPIIPLWANPHRQSELVGIRSQIDAYDLIKSGFANDLDDASMIYWTLENCGGMDDMDLARFVERMKTVKAAPVDGDSGAKAEAHTIEVPYASRVAYLERLEKDMYGDFGALDVASLQGGQKTATEIQAAYQPLDSKADDYEYCVLEFLERLFALAGVTEEPVFVRSRIDNQPEATQMVLMAAEYLDDETVLRHLPWLTPEETEEILNRKADADVDRLGG